MNILQPGLYLCNPQTECSKEFQNMIDHWLKNIFKEIIDKSRIFFIYIIDTSKRQNFFHVLIFKGKYLTSQVRHTTIVVQLKQK